MFFLVLQVSDDLKARPNLTLTYRQVGLLRLLGIFIFLILPTGTEESGINLMSDCGCSCL